MDVRPLSGLADLAFECNVQVLGADDQLRSDVAQRLTAPVQAA